MKLNPEGVGKAVTAVFGYINPDDDSWFQYKSIVEGILTAYFDHLRQEGLMTDAQLEFGGARYHATNPDAFILRTDKE